MGHDAEVLSSKSRMETGGERHCLRLSVKPSGTAKRQRDLGVLHTTGGQGN